MSTKRNTVISFDAPHSEVHEGDAFEVAISNDSLADNGTLVLYLVPDAGAKPLHLSILASCGGDCKVEIYKNPTVNVAGTEIEPKNMNDISSEVSGWTVRKDTTFTADGTEWVTLLLPGGATGNSVGTVARSGLERILDPSENGYFIRLTNIAGSAKIACLAGDWYEDELE